MKKEKYDIELKIDYLIYIAHLVDVKDKLLEGLKFELQFIYFSTLTVCNSNHNIFYDKQKF
jgi:hypothetical protein